MVGESRSISSLSYEIAFKCPNCGEGIGKEDKIDEIYSERIQSSDDLDGDPKASIGNKVELWYCLWCGRYFRAYYKLERITKLVEFPSKPDTAGDLPDSKIEGGD